MSRPFSFAGAVPEINSVSFVFVQEGFHPGDKLYNNILEGIDVEFKDLVSSRDRVSEDNDIIDVIIFYGKNEANVDDYEFSFDRGNIHCLDLELFSDRIVFPDVGNSYCYIGFFDTAISNDNGIMRGDL